MLSGCCRCATLRPGRLRSHRTSQRDSGRAWLLTRPDRTQFYFDCQGYQSAVVDRNGHELIGNDRLRSAPAEMVKVIDDGVLIAIAGDPAAWDTPEYAASEQRVRCRLGAELFFSKAEPDRLTVAPDWDS